MPNKLVMDWFDGLEAVLEAESKLSGLLGHNPTIGQAREFLVTRVLRTILPASVHIGSGKIVDADGRTSRQIDIVIYDPRFPLMKVEGGGLYFVEGVLATIEVKSTINSCELRRALDNCRSVLELSPHGEHPHEATRRISYYMNKGRINGEAAKHRFWYMFRPATYIFSFLNQLSLDTTCNCVKQWWEKDGSLVSTYFPLLPRTITVGNVVGFVNDGRINLQSSIDSVHTMAFFHTEHRFRWLCLHLMDAVSLRMGLRNFAEQFDYRISDYYPLSDYMSEISSQPAKIITRTPT